LKKVAPPKKKQTFLRLTKKGGIAINNTKRNLCGGSRGEALAMKKGSAKWPGQKRKKSPQNIIVQSKRGKRGGKERATKRASGCRGKRFTQSGGKHGQYEGLFPLGEGLSSSPEEGRSYFSRLGPNLFELRLPPKERPPSRSEGISASHSLGNHFSESKTNWGWKTSCHVGKTLSSSPVKEGEIFLLGNY